MSQKPHQFQIQQAKRQEDWNYKMQAAQTDFQNKSDVAATISKNRLACITLATKVAGEDASRAIEIAQQLEKFVNEPISEVEFKLPDTPVVDSKIVSIDGV